MTPHRSPRSRRAGSLKLRHLAGIAGAALTLALAGPAAAQAAGGAHVIKHDSCQENPFGTVCVDLHAVFNMTDAGASGNMSVVSNLRSVNTWAGKGVMEGCTARMESRINDHQLLRADDSHQLHFKITYQSSSECKGSRVDCRTETLYTYANGEVRVDAVRHSCKGPLD